MKESKLIEMKNKVETLGKLMEQVLTELHHLRDLSVGTMSLVKKFPQYNKAIEKLKDVVDADAATKVWEESISSQWQKNPVWVHGDLSADNILIKNNRITAIIDFGCMVVGDPSCDLVLAWTFFNKKSRKVFKNSLSFDEDTWSRARGWCLWKALITLADIEDKFCSQALKQRQIIKDVLAD